MKKKDGAAWVPFVRWDRRFEEEFSQHLKQSLSEIELRVLPIDRLLGLYTPDRIVTHLVKQSETLLDTDRHGLGQADLLKLVVSEVKLVGCENDSEFPLSNKSTEKSAKAGWGWIFVHARSRRKAPKLCGNDAVPQRAELILRFALPKEQREYLIGDLDEEFRSEMVPKFGYRVAARWYWVQVLKAVAGAFGARLRVWLGISALTSAVGWVIGKIGL